MGSISSSVSLLMWAFKCHNSSKNNEGRKGEMIDKRDRCRDRARHRDRGRDGGEGDRETLRALCEKSPRVTWWLRAQEAWQCRATEGNHSPSHVLWQIHPSSIAPFPGFISHQSACWMENHLFSLTF